MHPFEQTVSVVGPVVAGIIVLSIFFKLLARWGTSGESMRRVGLKGILDDKSPATVHLTTGVALENVRFIGFTNPDSMKGPFPFELRGMVIFEHPDGRRTIVAAKMIKMIEVPPKMTGASF